MAITLRRWVSQRERDTGQRPGPATGGEERVKALEREVRELRKANEILRLASALSAQAERGRRFKPWGHCDAYVSGRSAG